MKKLLSTTILVGVIATAGFNASFADVASTALPVLDSATNADVTTSQSNMNIQIQGGQGSVGTLNWNSYNVGSDATVNYEFTAHNQTALNKVAATGGLSQIYGRITNSGCAGCGYEGTGKVILLNPNGVFFGNGANVDLNSFTVSTMDGSYNADAKTLNLNRTSTSPYGIIVREGAQIYGDKNVTFASDNVKIYNGSKITTNIGPNVGSDSFGKIKIVTSDGVNFNYYNNGAVKSIDGVKTATDKMTINVNGQLASGQIDIRNYSSNADSEINLNGAALKAVKAVNGNDGNIWLTASNKVVVDNSTFETANYSDEAASKAGGNISILADKKASVKASTFKSVGDIEVISNKADAIVDSSNVTAAKNITVKAGNIASAQNNSTLTAKNITIEGVARSQVHESTLNATNNINLNSTNDVWFSNANLKGKKIVARATNGNVTGSANLNNNQTELYAGKDIDVVLAKVGNSKKGLVAEADQNVTIKTNGALSVSRLVAKHGDMTLESDSVIAGLPYTTEEQIPGDEANRSYIYVRNGKFTSKAPFEVKNSDTFTEDGKYQIRHHITYGDGNEKILLINPREYVPGPTPPEPQPDINPAIDDSQAKRLNRLPRQPESYNTNNTVADTRTTFVDVFAAASQIEIEDDEEE